ncbi:MAG: hypothetical protein ABIY40_01145 [Rhodanobacteraceae bacterium]
MNTSKTLTFAASFLISCAGVAGIRAWANAAAMQTMTAPDATLETIQTLPTITVRPTREQLEVIRRASPIDAGVTTAGGMALDMPYYLFAVKSRRASKS